MASRRLKNGPAIVIRPGARKRACIECNEYSAHMSHGGLVYQFFNDADGGYHRHIAWCPDLGLRVQTEKIQ